MNENNPYQQYGYDQFEQATPVASPQKKGTVEKIFGQRVAMKFKNPLFTTAALLLAGSAFATIIVMSYPDDSSMQDVPVIKAEKLALKEMPSTVGGMEIPFQESTIFTAVRNGQLDESAPIENLLDQESEADRFADFVDEAAKALGDNAAEEMASADESSAVTMEMSETAPVEIKKIVQKTENTSDEKTVAVMAESQRRPHNLHAPGSSPETLAFVRSVLDKKDAKKMQSATQPRIARAPAADVSASALANIEPAAGAAIGADVQPGGYFVQLGSVTSASGAEGEWGKLYKAYGYELGSAAHRIQQADLGARGTYYRIQAGPMSKDSAASICDAIKARKPGACLVVK